LKGLAEVDLGAPLHSLVIAGKLHPLETDFLRLFANNKRPEEFDNLVQLHNKYFSTL
jgi:diphthamide biosynthesis methyltransferase